MKSYHNPKFAPGAPAHFGCPIFQCPRSPLLQKECRASLFLMWDVCSRTQEFTPEVHPPFCWWLKLKVWCIWGKDARFPSFETRNKKLERSGTESWYYWLEVTSKRSFSRKARPCSRLQINHGNVARQHISAPHHGWVFPQWDTLQGRGDEGES